MQVQIMGIMLSIFTTITVFLAVFYSFAAIAEIVISRNLEKIQLKHSVGAAIFWTFFYILK